MKRRSFLGLLAVMGLSAGSLLPGAYASEAPKAYEVPMERAAEMSAEDLSTNILSKTKNVQTKCLRRFYYRYYYPSVYYVPAYYTYTYDYTFYRTTYRPVYNYSYYCYSYVWFYKGLDGSAASGERGLRMEAAPDAGTPLAKLGVKKGDVITHIDGAAVRSEKDMNKVTENSTLTVLKATAASGNSENDARETGNGNFPEWLSRLR